VPWDRRWGDIACGTVGRAGEEEIFDDENDRAREFDGVVSPDRESEGDIDIGVNGEGEAIISLLLR